MHGWDVCMAGGACTARGVCGWRTHVCIGAEPCWGQTVLGGRQARLGVCTWLEPHPLIRLAIKQYASCNAVLLFM